MLKKFKDLTEREILAIAIANEEEDGRIYGEFAEPCGSPIPLRLTCLKRCGSKRRATATGSCSVPYPFWGTNTPDPS